MNRRKTEAKVVLLGKECGGKTSLILRYLHNSFNELVPYQTTIGASFGTKQIPLDNNGSSRVVLRIWDTAGSERYRAMSRMYYRDAWAAVICYDLTDNSSLDQVNFWAEQLRTHEPNCRIYLCGTKKDLVISTPENDLTLPTTSVKKVTEMVYNCATSFETSSKTGENVEELFECIAKEFLEHRKQKRSSSRSTSEVVGLSAVNNRSCYYC